MQHSGSNNNTAGEVCFIVLSLYLVFTTHTHSRMNMTFDKFANDHLDRFVLPN